MSTCPATNIPEEIFHRIMWNHHLHPQAALGTLPSQYHLQKDRQTRFYALPDFQIARLVCRTWNQWLLKDFAFWQHLCIQGETSLTITKDVLDRFPNHSFHIRIRIPDHHFLALKPYDYGDLFDSDSEDEDGVDEDEESRGSKERDAEWSDEEDEFPGPMGETRKAFGPWVEETEHFMPSILHRCEAICLHLPPQILHPLLISWTNIGAPNLRRFLVESPAITLGTSMDMDSSARYKESEVHKYDQPPLIPFLRKSPKLTSIALMNYYVPAMIDEHLGCDLTRLEEFAVVCGAMDSPSYNQLGMEMAANLLIPLASNKCKSFSFELTVFLMELNSDELYQPPQLEKVTFGRGKFIINSKPQCFDLPSTSRISHIRYLTLKSTRIILRFDLQEVKTPHRDIIQSLLEEMPVLESLYLIEVHYDFPYHRSEFPVIQLPPAPEFPKFKRLLIERGRLPLGSILPLLSRSPSLTELTMTCLPDYSVDLTGSVEEVIQGLGALSPKEAFAGCAPVMCPRLRHMQILMPEMIARPEKLEEKISGLLKKLQVTRQGWVAEERCESLEIRCTPMSDFREVYYGVWT
ncbi:hypothetical protein SISSUDRAFT_1047615 [Sistotremastrum suecicum HHB10207 ss-3]|uniref:F-box domain-containing protein n=1 Tax=Sistotremastrum suecicum HHB10207 ss-3 TaxID=1314776 RepID=A0A166D0R9_9AGAM|nr:hypothetical protein SISSUDRAFT_1047615 [Sistotremastrum suecicum HHB10207 ss-3]